MVPSAKVIQSFIILSITSLKRVTTALTISPVAARILQLLFKVAITELVGSWNRVLHGVLTFGARLHLEKNAPPGQEYVPDAVDPFIYIYIYYRV
jgi:hypothetical protein